MPLSHTIEFVTLEELAVDPRNPRLGLGATEPLATQERVLELMRGWNLEELAVSFLENGFWPQEAVSVVKERQRIRVRAVGVGRSRRALVLARVERTHCFQGQMDGQTVELARCSRP